jgi:hypothetical protein
MTARISIEEAEQRLQEIDPSSRIVPDTYRGWFSTCSVKTSRGLITGKPHLFVARELIGTKKTHVLTPSEVEIRVRVFNPRLSLVHETFTTTGASATWIDDEFGEFSCRPCLLLYRKQKGHPACAQETKEATCLQKFGVSCTFTNEKCNVARRERSANMRGKPIPEFEHWHANKTPQDEERRKSQIKETIRNRYGVDYAMQNVEIFQRSQRSGRDVWRLRHWQTGEEVIARGGYEHFVFSYLNRNRISYQTQIPFDTPHGRYFCDLYLPELDVYVEVKGFFRQDARQKWEWFTSHHTNAELWGRDKLKSLGWSENYRKTIGEQP